MPRYNCAFDIRSSGAHKSLAEDQGASLLSIFANVFTVLYLTKATSYVILLFMSETFDTNQEERFRRWHLEYLERREQKLADVFERLSEREQQLVREAAVSGFVSGMLHMKPTLTPRETPDDEVMVDQVIGNALAFPESYPLLGRILFDEGEAQPTSEQ